jgi:hypothetical protein
MRREYAVNNAVAIRKNCHVHGVCSRFCFFEELSGDPEACRADAAVDRGERAAASAAFFFLKSEAPAYE